MAGGAALTSALNIPAWSLAAAAALASAASAVVAARAAPAPPSVFAGADALSSSLMALFFAACGAQAGSPASLRAAAPLGAFVGTLLAIQLAATLAVGRLLRLPPRALVVAANAAVGGPGTAAAFATARGWRALVRPALVAGSIGYGVGTAVGVGVVGLLRRGVV